MNLKKKLNVWQENNVIDAATADAIRRFEDAQPKMSDQLWRYGLLGLGVLCVGLGLLFVIAANWQEIPFSVKLTTHAVLNIGLAAWVLRTLLYPSHPWSREIPLIFVAAGQLSLMALIGQYLQISSPIKDVMLFWWCLIAPMVLLLGTTMFSAALLLGLGLYVFFAHVEIPDYYFLILLMSGAFTLYVASTLDRLKAFRPGWSHAFEQVGFYTTAIIAFISLIEPNVFHSSTRNLYVWNTLVGMMLTGALACFYFNKTKFFSLHEKPWVTEATVLSLGAITVMQIVASGYDGSNHNEFLDLVLFCLYFLGLARIGHHHQKTLYLSASILMIAGRLIVYFASLWNNLLLNGVTMIGIGIGAILLLRKFTLKKGEKHV